MKKIFALLLSLGMVAVMILVPAQVALGEDVNVPTTDLAPTVTEPFTWSYLATVGGAAVFTLFVVQFAKAPLDKVWKIPTRFLVYVIALVTMLAATALTTGLNIDTVLLSVVNALLAATSAYGMYEVTFAKLSK